MTTVTGLTAERMLAIEAESVIDGDIVGDNLILTKHDGTQINAGNVRGNPGPIGPAGQDLAVLAAAGVLDVGAVGQIRAGRQLTAVDFTNMGLSAPIALWNLSDLSDASGNGHALNNKGAIPFGIGINGVANSAAQFAGSAAQALYIPDTGANDPFRIRVGSLGCWLKTPRRGIAQVIMGKWSSSVAGVNAYTLIIDSVSNKLGFFQSSTGSDSNSNLGSSDVCDDRWHHAVVTFDGNMIKLYLDGNLDVVCPVGNLLNPGAAPFNVGSHTADAATAPLAPWVGRLDEVFVTGDILTATQIRNLYCARVSHTLGALPSRATLNVRRRRRGASLVAGDFPAQPLRLYNFSGGSLGDEGSGGVALVNTGAAMPVAGADGTAGNAFNFAGAQNLASTDAGLPAGVVTRSYGCWFKTASLLGCGIIGWGTISTGDVRLFINAGVITCYNAVDQFTTPFLADGMWHQAIVVEDNGAIDGTKRKLYLDGKLLGSSTVLNPIVLAGAGHFVIGNHPSGTGAPFIGQIDAVFVCDRALTFEQVIALYAKGTQAHARSPKNAGDHIEAMSATDLLVAFDSIDSVSQIDLTVAA
jgi:hypothetical protein